MVYDRTVLHSRDLASAIDIGLDDCATATVLRIRI